jgi:hypothetical protein
VFDELNRRNAVVYVHPTDAPCCQELMPGTQPGAVEYNTDTARTIFSLLATNAATRYNNIRFIFSHGGGTMPSLVERFGVGQPDNINQNLRGTPRQIRGSFTCAASTTTQRNRPTSCRCRD